MAGVFELLLISLSDFGDEDFSTASKSAHTIENNHNHRMATLKSSFLNSV